MEINEVDTEIELMLWCNVLQAMEPWEVVNYQKNYEPYAIKTKLGWVVCGVPGNNRGIIGIHRTCERFSIFNI